jgi:hypothetical protein
MNQSIRFRLPGCVLSAWLILLIACVLLSSTPTPADAARRSGEPSTPAARLTCPDATTLEELVRCIMAQGVYVSGTVYAEPGTSDKAQWQTVVKWMMNGDCDRNLPGSLEPVMTLKRFTDSDNGRSYCVLFETADADEDGRVDNGWGSFITYDASTKALIIHAPHPVYDSTTEDEAIRVFKQTGARAFLLMGAFRNASEIPACQSGYYISDPAHDVRDVFNPTTVEIRSYYGSTPYWTIQFHGMGASSCSSHVHMSNGFSTLPPAGTRIWQLYDAMTALHPDWSIDLAGEGSCSLNGANSPTGRIINGVSIREACTTSATTNTGAFIHIEQDPGYRTAGDWIPAINSVWP